MSEEIEVKRLWALVFDRERDYLLRHRDQSRRVHVDSMEVLLKVLALKEEGKFVLLEPWGDDGEIPAEMVVSRTPAEIAQMYLCGDVNLVMEHGVLAARYVGEGS